MNSFGWIAFEASSANSRASRAILTVFVINFIITLTTTNLLKPGIQRMVMEGSRQMQKAEADIVRDEAAKVWDLIKHHRISKIEQ